MKYKIKLRIVFATIVVVFSAMSAQSGEVPTIITHPQSVTLEFDETHLLFVDAISEDGGTLTYQWWISMTEDETISRPIAGATEKSLLVSYNDGGELKREVVYYFVVVTNNSSATAKSNLARVTNIIRIRTNAAIPVITIDPKNTSAGLNEKVTLSLSASSPDGGNLSYQWFLNSDINDVTGWISIEGAITDSYVPDVSEAGTLYYRVIVMNTNSNVDGEQTASQTSGAAAVAVAEDGKINAAFPIISGPYTIRMEMPNDPTELSVSAESPDGGTLSYQWFKTEFEGNVGGEPIEGATGAKYDPGMRKYSHDPLPYYYVEVTNTNTKVNGEQKAITKSSAVQVIDGQGGIASILSDDRTIPSSKPDAGGAVIPPLNIVAGEFTAGPNPVDRQANGIAFFWSGKRISGTLTVYDATGNVVKKISVKDSR